MPEVVKIASIRRSPPACFDTIEYIEDAAAPDYLTPAQRNDFDMARDFLRAYTGSLGCLYQLPPRRRKAVTLDLVYC